MKQAAEKWAGWPASMLATLIAVMFASILTAWAAAGPAGLHPALAPTRPVEIQLRPADITDGPADFDSASMPASWDPKIAREGRTGNRIIDHSPSLRPSVLDTAVRGSLQ